MNEDPTRIMSSGDGPERRRPPRGRPPQQHPPRGNMRLVVAVMGAVIFGLLIALLVGSCSGGTTTVTVTTEPEYIEPTQPFTPGNEETETPAEEKEAEEEAEGAEGETGGIEETELEEGLEGGVEEVVPEEEGGVEEVVPEEEGGGVSAE
jgi:phage tail tape-measure protein